MRTIEAIADPVATGVETNDTMKALVYGVPASERGSRCPSRLLRPRGCRGPDHDIDDSAGPTFTS